MSSADNKLVCEAQVCLATQMTDTLFWQPVIILSFCRQSKGNTICLPFPFTWKFENLKFDMSFACWIVSLKLPASMRSVYFCFLLFAVSVRSLKLCSFLRKLIGCSTTFAQITGFLLNRYFYTPPDFMQRFIKLSISLFSCCVKPALNCVVLKGIVFDCKFKCFKRFSKHQVFISKQSHNWC